MERIQQAFDNLKERLNNPLVFSFVISWIFLNWKVTVALLWHNSSNDDNSHIKLINFIVENTSVLNSIVIPLGYAILYTFLSPIIKNLIVAFQNWNFTWGNNWNLKILRESYLPIKKYIELKEKYDDSLKSLSIVLEGEGETKRKLQEEIQTNASISSELHKCRTESNITLDLLNNYNNIEVIKGKWIKSYPQSGIRENWEIKNNSFVTIYLDTRQDDIYRIDNFSFDKRTGWISFALFHLIDKEKGIQGFYSFNRLKLEFEELSGEEWKHSVSEKVVFRKDK